MDGTGRKRTRGLEEEGRDGTGRERTRGREDKGTDETRRVSFGRFFLVGVKNDDPEGGGRLCALKSKGPGWPVDMEVGSGRSGPGGGHLLPVGRLLGFRIIV